MRASQHPGLTFTALAWDEGTSEKVRKGSYSSEET